MTSNQFFVKRIDPEAETVIVEGDEHHHLARVARIRRGDTVWIFDEAGRRFLAEVEDVGREKSLLRIIRPGETEAARTAVVLGQALIKPGSMDLVIQKAVELGVSAVIPLVSARSLPLRDGRGAAKGDRWRKIALEAAKQSRRATVPEIGSPMDLDEFLRRDTDARKLYLSENGGARLGDLAVETAGRGAVPAAVVAAVGPEGGWAPEEERGFREHGFEPVSLGRTVIRAETAAIAAAVLIGHFWNA